jgi:hypothetical protein
MKSKQKCLICNFESDSKVNFAEHFLGRKHKGSVTKLRSSDPTVKICEYCGSSFKHPNNFYRHRKNRCEVKCDVTWANELDEDAQLRISELEHENEKLKLEMKYQVKLGKAEEKDKCQQQLIEVLQSHINTVPVTVNCQQNINTLITNNKCENLNRHCSDVLDMDTFIENYKTKYPLSYHQTKILLENYQMSGIRSYVPGFFSYLQNNYLDQMRELSLADNDNSQSQDIILPFISSDASLRSHFEKSKHGWRRSNNLDKIKKLIIISNDQIYKHHNEVIPMTPYESQMIANAILRKSTYNNAHEIIEKRAGNVSTPNINVKAIKYSKYSK